MAAIQEEARSGDQILGEGLENIIDNDEFNQAMRQVSEIAFEAVFRAQDEGKLQWRRGGDELTDFVTEAVVKNGRGEEIAIPVVFFIACSPEGFMDGYLMLGSKRKAPCRNTASERVQGLYTQITGKPWPPR